MNYQRMHPHLLKVISNFECIASITSVLGSDTDFSVQGNFRTKGDYVGLIWTSVDDITNPYCSYATNADYTGFKLSFDCEYTNICLLDNVLILPSLVLKKNDDTERYITLGFLRPTIATQLIVDPFTTKTSLNQNWIAWNSEVVNWTKDGVSGIGVLNTDYVIDYVLGLISPMAGGNMPYAPKLTIDFEYHNGNHFDIDFNNLYEGDYYVTSVKVPVTDIKEVIIPIMPPNYIMSQSLAIPSDETNLIMTGSSDIFEFKVTNWTLTGADLNVINPNREQHKIRYAEGYDDENDRNPTRLINTMVQMGFSGMVDIYIGASHFYDKNGTKDVVSVDYTSMILDNTVTINNAFRNWLTAYLNEMKANGFTDIVTSISMENLQMPDTWKQRLSDGSVGQTGWIPPTNFYSPCNTDVRTYIENVTKDILNIVVGVGFTPILQLGEPWWWWQTALQGQPPCIYDDASKAKYQSDNGSAMPIITDSSNVLMTGDNLTLANWCNAQLVDYSNFMKSIVKSYSNGLYTALFFPPSVIDPTNTPYFISMINYPENAWNNNQLDFMQIEDYDWIDSGTISEYHEDTFYLVEEELGYKRNKQHYFAGYVAKVGDMDTWNVILKEAYRALGMGFAEVFLWAGTQIRRDNVNVENKYIGELVNSSLINTTLTLK